MVGASQGILGLRESTISKTKSTAEDLRKILQPEIWQASQTSHRLRATGLTEAWQAKHMRNETDPIEDFLFQYYSYRPALLKRWHPGAGVALEGTPEEFADFGETKWYRYTDSTQTQLEFDAKEFLQQRGSAVDYIEKLLRVLVARTPRLGCFGLHEWAMVYKQQTAELRHDNLPLRLSQSATDRVVENHQIVCSHFDAYRFFTTEATPLNSLRPTRQAQEDFEQPGCLHAGMDSYKWAIKLGPLVPGELLLDTFELAKEIRYLDMRASPYDVSELGLRPVAIETEEGKAEYAAQQEAFAISGQELRKRLLTAIITARIIAEEP